VTLLITACSKDKCTSDLISVSDLGRGTADELAQEWVRRLANVSLHTATNLYAGRGHRYAARAAGRHNVDHLIMSAGVGFVKPTDEIPAYRLTVKNDQEDSILPHLFPPAGGREWWNAIQSHSPWARSLTAACEDSNLIIVAVPLDYLQLLLPELESLPSATRERVRILSGASSSALPESVRVYHLPYDARLDGPDSPERGPGSDFLGRAVTHFLDLIEGFNGECVERHKEHVEQALKSLRPAERRHGRSLSDDAISAMIRSQLRVANRGSRQLLSLFRHELGIACEQGRFRRLYADVVAELAAA
jgi:hypothetical protein